MQKINQESSLLFYCLLFILLSIVFYFGYQIIRAKGEPSPTIPEKGSGLYQRVGKPNRENLNTILKNASSKDSKKRLMSLRALQYYGSSQARHILPFLQDPDKTIRITALQILGNLRHVLAIQPILKSLQNHKSVTSNIMGIQALTKICQGRSYLPEVTPVLEYLLSLLKKPNPAVSGHAGGALRTLTNHIPNLLNPSKIRLYRYWKKWLKRRKSE